MRSKQCNNFLWQVQYGFFLDTYFSSHLLEELWNHKDFVLWEIGFARGTLHSALRTTGTASARFHECSCIQSPSQDHVQDLNCHLCCCVFLYFLFWKDSGRPQHCVCRHLPTEQSSAQCSEQWDRLLTAVGEMLESKFSREPSFLQSSSCSS